MARELGLGGIVNAEINIEQLSPTDSLADRLAEIDDEELPTGLERIRLINNSTMLATPKNESPSYSTRSNESRRRGGFDGQKARDGVAFLLSYLTFEAIRLSKR